MADSLRGQVISQSKLFDPCFVARDLVLEYPMLADKIPSLIGRNIALILKLADCLFVNLLELQLDLFKFFVYFSNFSIGFCKPTLKCLQGRLITLTSSLNVLQQILDTPD